MPNSDVLASIFRKSYLPQWKICIFQERIQRTKSTLIDHAYSYFIYGVTTNWGTKVSLVDQLEYSVPQYS